MSTEAFIFYVIMFFILIYDLSPIDHVPVLEIGTGEAADNNAVTARTLNSSVVFSVLCCSLEIEIIPFTFFSINLKHFFDKFFSCRNW
jgi:hypothetical protein